VTWQEPMLAVSGRYDTVTDQLERLALTVVTIPT
jgi:hypothetical protein